LIDKTLLRQVADLVFYPQYRDTSEITRKITELEQKSDRYRHADFRELAIQCGSETTPLKRQLDEIEKAKKANDIVDLGYFVIQDPEWDYYYGSKGYPWRNARLKDRLHNKAENGLIPIRKIRRRDSIFSNLADERVLCCVPTNQFKANVPDFVIERVLEEKEKNIFCSFDILFVTRIGDIDKMVREFVVDPILVGRWSVGKRFRNNGFGFWLAMPNPDMTEEERQEWYDKHYYESEPSKQSAVLAIWGTDLEEIDIALLSSHSLQGSASE